MTAGRTARALCMVAPAGQHVCTGLSTSPSALQVRINRPAGPGWPASVGIYTPRVTGKSRDYNGIHSHEAEDADGNVIKDEQGNPVMVEHKVRDDIAEAAERRMTDILARPVFLHGFPAELKAFYMKKIKADGEGVAATFTESCDLMPGVGEIVGGSMRIADAEEMLAVYKREGIEAEPYYSYMDPTSNWMSVGMPTKAAGTGRTNAFGARAPSVRKA